MHTAASAVPDHHVYHNVFDPHTASYLTLSPCPTTTRRPPLSQAITRIIRLPQYVVLGPVQGMEARMRPALADPSVLDYLPDLTPQEHRPHRHPTDISMAARIQNSIKCGSIERAASALELQSMAQASPDTTTILQTIHPQAEPPMLPEKDTPPLSCDAQTQAEVRRNLNSGKAANRHPATCEMPEVAAFNSPPAQDNFDTFVNAMIAFDMPRVIFRMDSKGLAFTKRNSTGLRRIAITEAWLRLAGAVALKLLGDAGAAIAPEQLRVGIKGGPATSVMHLKPPQADTNDTTVLCHD